MEEKGPPSVWLDPTTMLPLLIETMQVFHAVQSSFPTRPNKAEKLFQGYLN